MLKINLLIFFIIVFIFSLALSLLWNYIAKIIKSNITLKKFANGKKGEIRAKDYLLNRGFKIIAEQPSIKKNIFIDGQEFFYEIRADFIIQKKGKKALVEVKTGKEAVDPLSTNTRRQLFEYSYSYDIDKVYLLDADSMKMKEISFVPKRDRSAFFIYLIIFIIALCTLILPYLSKIIRNVLF